MHHSIRHCSLFAHHRSLFTRYYSLVTRHSSLFTNILRLLRSRVDRAIRLGRVLIFYAGLYCVACYSVPKYARNRVPLERASGGRHRESRPQYGSGRCKAHGPGVYLFLCVHDSFDTCYTPLVSGTPALTEFFQGMPGPLFCGTTARCTKIMLVAGGPPRPTNGRISLA